MRKEDLKNTIDSIEPDLYMQTRLKAKTLGEIKLQRTFKKVACALSCLVLSFAVAFGTFYYKDNGTQKAEEKSNPSAVTTAPISNFILLASAKESEEKQAPKQLEFNEKNNFDYFLKVTDVRGKSTAEQQQAIKDMTAYFKSNISGYDSTCINVCGEFENAVIGHMILNSFKLDIENEDKLDNIVISNKSDYGYMEYQSNSSGMFTYYDNKSKIDIDGWYHGKEIKIEAEDYLKNKDWLQIHWRHSAEMDEAINVNPDIPLSAFSDEITFTVNYTDGTIAKSVVYLQFNDDGSSTITCKNAN